MQYIHSDQAPKAIGPYSQAVVTGGLVYISGQLPLTTEGKLVADSIAAQTRQVMKNLEAILIAAGSSLGQVVSTKAYLSSRELFQEFNKTYSEFFSGDAKPARECVIALPPVEGADVEISLVAEITRN